MKKNIKKIILLLLVLIILICVTSLMNKDNESSENKNTETNTETNTEKETQTVEVSIGEWNDNEYTNDFLGLKFNLPVGWTRSTDEEIEYLNKQMAEQNGIYYLSATHQSTGNNINIFGEKIENDMTVEDYINQLKEELTELNNISYQIGEVSKKEVAGKQYDVLELTANMYGVQILQRYYICKVDENIVGIIITSNTGKDIIDEVIGCFE